MTFRSLLARMLALALMVFVPALAAAQTINGLGIKDGSGASQTLCSYVISSTFQIGCYTPHYWNGSAFVVAPADSSGRPYGAAPSGAYVDGWDATEGTKADTACASSASTCSVASILKGLLAAAQPTSATPVNPTPTPIGGCNSAGFASAATTNATSIKAAAALFCGGTIVNTTATVYYLRLYNLSAAPTCSSATGFVASIPIPASTSGNGTVVNVGPYGAYFNTGLAYCFTGGASSTDNTNAATGVFGILNYE